MAEKTQQQNLSKDDINDFVDFKVKLEAIADIITDKANSFAKQLVAEAHLYRTLKRITCETRYFSIETAIPSGDYKPLIKIPYEALCNQVEYIRVYKIMVILTNLFKKIEDYLESRNALDKRIAEMELTIDENLEFIKDNNDIVNSVLKHNGSIMKVSMRKK